MAVTRVESADRGVVGISASSSSSSNNNSPTQIQTPKQSPHTPSPQEALPGGRGRVGATSAYDGGSSVKSKTAIMGGKNGKSNSPKWNEETLMTEAEEFTNQTKDLVETLASTATPPAPSPLAANADSDAPKPIRKSFGETNPIHPPPHGRLQAAVSVVTCLGTTFFAAADTYVVLGDVQRAFGVVILCAAFWGVLYGAILCSHKNYYVALALVASLSVFPWMMPQEMPMARYVLASSALFLLCRMVDLVLNSDTAFQKWTTNHRSALFLTFGDLRTSRPLDPSATLFSVIRVTAPPAMYWLTWTLFGGFLGFLSIWANKTPSVPKIVAYPCRWAGGFIIMYSLLALLDELNKIVFAVRRIEPRPNAESPLSTTLSIREAWSTKWNRTVQQLLKYCVFVPLVRAGMVTGRAMGWTFAASAFLHLYPALAGGLGWGCLLSIAAFFLLQPAIIVAESALKIRKWAEWKRRVWVYGMIFSFVPFIMEPFCQLWGW